VQFNVIHWVLPGGQILLNRQTIVQSALVLPDGGVQSPIVSVAITYKEVSSYQTMK